MNIGMSGPRSLSILASSSRVLHITNAVPTTETIKQTMSIVYISASFKINAEETGGNSLELQETTGALSTDSRLQRSVFSSKWMGEDHNANCDAAWHL